MGPIPIPTSTSTSTNSQVVLVSTTAAAAVETSAMKASSKFKPESNNDNDDTNKTGTDDDEKDDNNNTNTISSNSNNKPRIRGIGRRWSNKRKDSTTTTTTTTTISGETNNKDYDYNNSTTAKKGRSLLGWAKKKMKKGGIAARKNSNDSNKDADNSIDSSVGSENNDHNLDLDDTTRISNSNDTMKENDDDEDDDNDNDNNDDNDDNYLDRSIIQSDAGFGGAGFGGAGGSAGSFVYSVGLNDSQELPPMGEIATIRIEGGDHSYRSELSEIGDTAADLAAMELLEPEMIDGVEIIYNPSVMDIVYGDRGHPGTNVLMNALRETFEESNTTKDGDIDDDANSNNYLDYLEYSPKVYKVIKKRLRGRKFLIRAKQTQNERTSWREATKAENIHLLGDCFDEEKQRLLRRQRKRQLVGIRAKGTDYSNDRDDGDDDEDEDDDYGFDAKDGVPLALSRKLTPRHANLQKNPSSRRGNNVVRDCDRDRGKGGNSAGGDDDPLLQQVIEECQSVHDFARPLYGFIHEMDRGIAAEKKLAMMMVMHDGNAPLKRELDKLKEVMERMKYISIAPLFERIERIEDNMIDYSNNKKDRYDDEQRGRQKFHKFDNHHRRRGESSSSAFEQEGDTYVMQMDNVSYGERSVEEQEGEEPESPYDDDMDFQVDTEEILYDEVDHHNNNKKKGRKNNDGTKRSNDDEVDEVDSVKNGQVLELDDSNDEMSSVGESA